jgi:flagellin
VDERTAVLGQLQDYADEIDAIAAQTQWNGRALISGSASGVKTTSALSFLVDSTGGSVGFSFGSSRSFTVGTATSQLGFNTSDLNAASAGGADASGVADKINTALDRVKVGVREVGSFMARLTFKEDSLTVQYINTEAAYNRIMNANMAQEQVEASKFMILQQTATAMLAQANVAPQFLLTLFR